MTKAASKIGGRTTTPIKASAKRRKTNAGGDARSALVTTAESNGVTRLDKNFGCKHSQGSDSGQPCMPLDLHHIPLLTCDGSEPRLTVERSHRQASSANDPVSSSDRPRRRMRRQLRDKRCGPSSRQPAGSANHSDCGSPSPYLVEPMRRTVEPLPASLAARYSADALIFERVWTARARGCSPMKTAIAMRWQNPSWRQPSLPNHFLTK